MIGFLVLTITSALELTPLIPVAAFLLSSIIVFTFFIHHPRLNAVRAGREVETEIVSAVRFLILELKSERSLYHALASTSKNFALIGIYLDEIIAKVEMGKTLEEALHEAVEMTPSDHLRNVYWQLLNSLQTGADITSSLRVLLDDVVEEQKIRIQEYGRELNAISLFYMMTAIIIPTVGFTIITALLTFAGISFGLGVLITVWLLLAAIQYGFLMLSSNRRPAVEAY
ncbi:MAG: type II secretion system F family protein [Candidatus Woesearchaeota archaeon]